MEINEAIIIAKNSIDKAYAPYSNYKVGAALKGKSRENLFRL